MKEIKELVKKLKSEVEQHQQEVQKKIVAIEALEKLDEYIPAYIENLKEVKSGNPQVKAFEKRGPYKRGNGVTWGKEIRQLIEAQGSMTRADVLGHLINKYGSNKVTRAQKKISSALINLVYIDTFGKKVGKTREEDFFYLK